MSEFSITSSDFEEGGEIPKRCGYKHGNYPPEIEIRRAGTDGDTECIALIMDDPDAMGAVGKVWVHWLYYRRLKSAWEIEEEIEWDDDLHGEWPDVYAGRILGKTDFGEIGYGGPAPPDKRHTYIFKAYALDTKLDLKEGYSKQELEDAMKGHIIAEAKLTGTFAP